MGRPRGLARSSKAPRETRPAAAAFVAEYLRNSLLEMAGIDSSLFFTARHGGTHYSLKRMVARTDKDGDRHGGHSKKGKTGRTEVRPYTRKKADDEDAGAAGQRETGSAM